MSPRTQLKEVCTDSGPVPKGTRSLPEGMIRPQRLVGRTAATLQGIGDKPLRGQNNVEDRKRVGGAGREEGGQRHLADVQKESGGGIQQFKKGLGPLTASHEGEQRSFIPICAPTGKNSSLLGNASFAVELQQVRPVAEEGTRKKNSIC